MFAFKALCCCFSCTGTAYELASTMAVTCLPSTRLPGNDLTVESTCNSSASLDECKERCAAAAPLCVAFVFRSTSYNASDCPGACELKKAPPQGLWVPNTDASDLTLASTTGIMPILATCNSTGNGHLGFLVQLPRLAGKGLVLRTHLPTTAKSFEQ